MILLKGVYQFFLSILGKVFGGGGGGGLGVFWGLGRRPPAPPPRHLSVFCVMGGFLCHDTLLFSCNVHWWL
jgi:hypothetical protein